MSDTQLQLDDLLDAICERSLTADQVAAVERLASADPAARRRLVAMLTLDATLRWEHAAANAEHATGNAEQIAPFKPDLSPPRAKVRVPNSKFAIRHSKFAAAALLLLAACGVAIVLISLNPKPETRDSKLPAPVATVIDTSGGGTLLIGDRIASPGDDIAVGDLTLDAGSADFRLTSGVEVALRGSSLLTVHDPMRATLTRGTASFTCPHNAKGFTVRLPGGTRVIDLGTAFDVDASAPGMTSVRVQSGSVALAAATDAAAPITLTVGRVATVHPTGVVAITSDPMPQGTFSVADDDIVNADQSTLAAVEVAAPFAPKGSGLDARYINNGATDYTGASNVTTGGFSALDGGGITFTLDTTANPAGYDLVELRVLSGHDARRIAHNFDVAVAQVGDDAFVPLAAVRTGDDPGTTGRRLEVQTLLAHTGGAPLATGVARVRLTFHSDRNAGPETVYREIDVIGSPSASPTGTRHAQ